MSEAAIPTQFGSLQELQDFLSTAPVFLFGRGSAAAGEWQTYLRLAEYYGDAVSQARVLFAMGCCYYSDFYAEDPQQALAAHQQALAYAEQQQDTALQARILSALATIKINRRDYEGAIEAFSKGLHLAQLSGDVRVQFVLLNNIADFHDQVGNDLQAREQQQRALLLAQSSNDPHYVLTAQCNLLNSLTKLGDLDAALELYRKVMSDTLPAEELWADFLEVASRLFLARQDPRKALALAEEGLLVGRQFTPPRLQLELRLSQTFALLALERLPEAEQALAQAEYLCESQSPRPLRASFKLAQSRLLEAQKHPAAALEALKHYLALQQQIREQNVAAQSYLVNINARIALLEQEAENERLSNRELRQANEQLQIAQAALTQQARYDTLTGLCNRSFFNQQTAVTLYQLQRDQQAALIFIDLDGFKAVNDLYGHAAGDDLLRQVAQRLREVAPQELIGRMGGDEFVVLVQGKMAPHAEALAQDILDTLAQPFELLTGHLTDITASAGVAFAPDHTLDAQILQQQADLAMYTVKRQNPGNVLRYSPDLSRVREQELRLESELRGAAQRDELRLYYQGRFAVAEKDERGGQRLEGFEALIRWQHPRLGLLGPHAFVPLAEQSALIVSVGNWVLHEACRQAQRWDFNRSGLTMSLNISAPQFEQEDFVEQVKYILKRTGLVPARLLLEVTETLILRDLERAKSNIARLHALGVQVTMDDFGTGYSSLSVLQTLPLNHLKIDRSFVQRVQSSDPIQADQTADHTARVMLQAIVRLAHQLHIQVTAEGVETSEQLAFLHDLGCDHVQGFYLGRPQGAAQTQQRFALPSVTLSGAHRREQPDAQGKTKGANS